MTTSFQKPGVESPGSPNRPQLMTFGMRLCRWFGFWFMIFGVFAPIIASHLARQRGESGQPYWDAYKRAAKWGALVSVVTTVVPIVALLIGLPILSASLGPNPYATTPGPAANPVAAQPSVAAPTQAPRPTVAPTPHDWVRSVNKPPKGFGGAFTPTQAMKRADTDKNHCTPANATFKDTASQVATYVVSALQRAYATHNPRCLLGVSYSNTSDLWQHFSSLPAGDNLTKLLTGPGNTPSFGVHQNMGDGTLGAEVDNVHVLRPSGETTLSFVLQFLPDPSSTHGHWLVVGIGVN